MNEQKKTLKREIETIIEKKMVEFCATIKKKKIQHLQWKKITESLKSSWETEYKWASKSKYWSTENVYFKSQGKNGKEINRASLGCVLSRSVESDSWRPRGL